MIAYQTDKYLYVIDMEYSEFIAEVAKNGISSVATHLNTACVVLNNRFINTVNMYLPEITCHICEIGDSGQFLMNFSKMNDLSDLKFYEADGQQFSCQASYDAYLRSKGEEIKTEPVSQERQETETKTEEEATQEKMSFVPNPVIPSPVISSPTKTEENVEAPSEEENEKSEDASSQEESVEEKKDQEPVEENKGQEENMASTEPESQVKEPAEESKEEPTTLDSPQQKIFVSGIHRTIAKTLDRNLSSLPKLKDFGDKMIRGIHDYVNRTSDFFRQFALKQLTTDESLMSSFETDFEIETALGKSHNMLDSVLALPTYVSILSHNGFNNHWTSIESQITSSNFVRICPMAEIDSHSYGYIQEIPIHIEDVMEAREWLANQGYRIRNYKNNSEKLALYEQALTAVFMDKQKKFNPKFKVVDLEQTIENLAEDYVVPPVDTWQQVGTYVMDARTTSLSEQLNEIEEKGVRVASPESAAVTHPEVVSPLVHHGDETIVPPGSVPQNLEQEESDRGVIAASSKALERHGISLESTENSAAMDDNTNVPPAVSSREEERRKMYELFMMGRNAIEQESKKHR